MARRRSSVVRPAAAAASYVRSGESFLDSRHLGLPRSSALLAFGQESEALPLSHGNIVRLRRFQAAYAAVNARRIVAGRPQLPPLGSLAHRVGRGVHVSRGYFPPAKPPLTWRSLQMLSPRRVLFCIRRKIRREVMFAIRKNGRNGGRRYRRTQESQYAC